MLRWWREVGEGASLWANFKFKLNFIARSPLQLIEVLTMPRLQCLQEIGLQCVQYIITLPALLQLIIDKCPGIRKLLLRIKKCTIQEDEMIMLASSLVKFEQVDLTEFSISSTDEIALVEAAIAALSTVVGSRLRLLQIHGHRRSHSKLLAAAKGKVKIDIKYGSRHPSFAWNLH